MVSASSATDPDTATMTSWSDRGEPEHDQADLDRADARRAGLRSGSSTVIGGSWLCGPRCAPSVCRSPSCSTRTSRSSRWWAGTPTGGVLGVVHRVDDELADVVVLEPVEHCVPSRRVRTSRAIRSFARCCDTDGAGLPTRVGEFVDRQLAVDQRPQQLHPGGVGEHPEHLDDQADLVVRRACAHRPAYLHSYADSSATLRPRAHPCGAGWAARPRRTSTPPPGAGTRTG